MSGDTPTPRAGLPVVGDASLTADTGDLRYLEPVDGAVWFAPGPRVGFCWARAPDLMPPRWGGPLSGGRFNEPPLISPLAPGRRS